MTRRHGHSEAERQDTGRLGYRHDWEPVDERPLLVEYACQCRGCREHQGPWKDESERLMYEDAVEAHPRHEGEGPMAYATRIGGIVAGRYGTAAKGMPATRQSRQEQDRQLAKLRGQARGLPSGVEDYS